MKKIIAVILIVTTVLFAVSATVTELNEKMEAFEDQLSDFIPRSVSGMNLWADAHIGNIIPLNGLPHLGGGMTAGGALVPTDFIKTFKSAFTTPADEWEAFPLPAVSFDVRIGGFILPFDAGVHLMALENFDKEFWGVSASFRNCLTYGADIRLAILQEGVIIPALSIGAGYTKASGEFQLTTTNIVSSLNPLTGGSDPFVLLDAAYATEIYTATLQLSKKILLLTPFVGARAMVQNGTYTYSYSYTNIDGQSYNSPTQRKVEKSFSFNDLANSDIKYSVFAGLGVDFLIIQTTAGVSYDFSDSSWAGSISIHVKI